MPAWKKVIVSGSDAVLNSITATAGFTGSLFGTASFALTSSKIQGGTANYIPLWNTATSLTSSIISQSLQKIVIAGNLDVNGTGRFGIGSVGYVSIADDNYGGELGIIDDADNVIAIRYIDGTYRYGGNNPGNEPLIVSASNVGIGTATPNAKLDVNGNIIISGSAQITGSTSIRGTLNQASASLATGLFAHAQGLTVTASGDYSHAEGQSNIATGASSHAEGQLSTAIGQYSHAEGYGTITNGFASHTEGQSNIATGQASHAEGLGTTANGSFSHAEGYGTLTTGDYSHAEGLSTVALGNYQHVQGQYNLSLSAQSAFIIGNGVDASNRSNLIFASGSLVQITGSLIVKQNATTGSLNTSNRTLLDDRNRATIDWNIAALYDQQQPTSIQSVLWNTRTLNDSVGINSVRWTYRDLKDSTDYTSVDWENRTLTNTSGSPTLNWNVDDNGYAISSSYYYKSKIDLGVQQKFVDTPILSNTANYAGEVIIGAVDATVTLYDLVYLKHDGVWYPADQNNSLSQLLGICLEVPPVEDPQPSPYYPGPGSILLEGTITILSSSAYHNESPIVDNLDHGLPIYPKSGDGKAMTTTSPTSSGDYVRVLGHAYQQSSEYPDYWIMKFRPSNDWITI